MKRQSDHARSTQRLAEELEKDERLFIDGFFEDLDDKVAFLSSLYDDRREDEARLLCLVYLDGVANWLNHPKPASAENFSRALCEFCDDYPFELVLPGWLLERLPFGSAPRGLEESIQRAIARLPEDEAHRPAEFVERVEPFLEATHINWLKPHLWRGSVAHAVYAVLRSPGVHQLNGRHGLSFSHTHLGQPLERVGFRVLHSALRSLAARARKVSEETGFWFGVEDEAS